MTGSPWKPGGRRARPEDNRSRPLVLLILLIKIVGIVGFVGLLAASHYLPREAYGWRLGALLWFGAFGVAYVLVSSKLPGGERRWP